MQGEVEDAGGEADEGGDDWRGPVVSLPQPAASAIVEGPARTVPVPHRVVAVPAWVAVHASAHAVGQELPRDAIVGFVHVARAHDGVWHVDGRVLLEEPVPARAAANLWTMRGLATPAALQPLAAQPARGWQGDGCEPCCGAVDG